MWGETSLKEDPELRTPLQRGQCVLSPLHTWRIDTLGMPRSVFHRPGTAHAIILK